MNDTELESRIARIMNDNLNQQLSGVDRRPPAFQPQAHADYRRGRVRWLLPLASAAAVAAVTVGAVLLADANRSPRHAGATAGATTHPSSPPSVPNATVTLAGARVVLPVGWVARDLGLNMGSTSAHVWCLMPAGHVLGKDATGCPLTFGSIDPKANPVDVDTQGGWLSNPHYCFNGSNRKTSEQAGDRPFGGRGSDWRHWSVTCTGHDFEIEQYVVAENPGFNLFSAQADATVHAAMAEIARNSILPAQVGSLRLMDRGYLRSVTITGSTAHVVIDRAIPLEPSGVINVNGVTHRYDVPLALYSGAGVKVGQMVSVYTNGTSVRDFARV